MVKCFRKELMPKKATQPTEGEEEKTAPTPVDIDALVARGREQGFITQQEILAAVGDAEDNVEELDEIYAALLENGVEITDQRETIGEWDEVVEAEPEVVVVENDD